MSSAPKTAKAWTVQGKNGFDSLKLNEKASVPEVSDYEVLVKLHAASLNYRDLIIPKGTSLEDNYPPDFKLLCKLTTSRKIPIRLKRWRRPRLRRGW